MPKQRESSAKFDKNTAMLLDIQYTKSRKKEGLPDFLYIIWKDTLDGAKHLTVIQEPTVPIYFEKPQYRNHSYNKNYAPLDTLDRKIVKYKDIIYAIVDDIGAAGQSRLNEIFNTQNYKALNEFLTYPYVYGADYDVRSIYRYHWLMEYDNPDVEKIITKGFCDIESNLTNADGFPNSAVDPIDLVTLIDTSTHTSYTFCLLGIKYYGDDPYIKELNESQLKMQEYYANNPEELSKAAYEMFDENYPGMEYKFYFYKNEAKMLLHLFELINELKLDFIGFWNIQFDIPYILKRLEVLGLDPKEVICHDDFPVKECYYKMDTHHFEIKNQTDFFNVTSYTIYYCQMRTYAAIRKGQSELRNNKLTYIAEREIGDEKLNYEDEGNLRLFALKNWLKYVLYNIKDVLLQCGIEECTNDVDTYYFRSYKNMTPYADEFKQTVVLRNVQYKSFLSQGLVPGENINAFKRGVSNDTEIYNENDDNDEDEKYEGALVGNPALNGPFGMSLYGKPSNCVFLYSVDFDMSAFYPSCIRANNIDPSTLIFKMIMDPAQYDVRGGDLPYHGITDVQLVNENNDSFSEDIAKEVIDNFQTRHYLTFGEKWLNLPGVTEMDRIVSRYLDSDFD